MVFVAACISAFSGMVHVQELALFLLCELTILLCGRWKYALKVCITFIFMFLCDLYVVGQLTGVPQYAAMLFCHILRFMLPLLASFYVVTKTSTVGEYISAFMAMRLPGEVIVPLAVMFRFVPTVQEEWNAINQAMRLRGLAPNWKNILLRPLDMMEFMLVPFLLQCSNIVDEMSAAVMARGFDKNHPRTSYIEVKMKILDWCMVMVALGLTVWNLII